MKKRLLVPLSVLMVAGNAEGMQAASLSTVELASTMAMGLPVTMGTPATQAANTIEATTSNIVDKLKEAQDGDILSLAAGNYEGITIKKRITLLITAGTVTLTNVIMDVPASILKATPTVGYGMVVVQGSAQCIVTGGTYINNVSGKGQTLGTEASYIFALDENATGSIEISNANLQLKGNNQRAIGNRSDAGTFTVTGTTITGETGVYKNTIGIYCAGMGKVTMDGGSISGVKYGIQVSGSNQVVELKGNAAITGWAALYLFGATNATVTIGESSVLTGKTYYENLTESSANDFGTIVFEGGSGSTVTSLGTIQNAYNPGATAKQYPVLFSTKNESGTHTLNLNGGKVIAVGDKTPCLIGHNTKTNKIMAASGVEFTGNGQPCALITNATGFKNAVPVSNAFDYVVANDTLKFADNTPLTTSVDLAVTIAGKVNLKGEGISMKQVAFKDAVAVTANAATISGCKFGGDFTLQPAATGAYTLTGNTFASAIQAVGVMNDAQISKATNTFATGTKVTYLRKATSDATKFSYSKLVDVSGLSELLDNMEATGIIDASGISSANILAGLQTKDGAKAITLSSLPNIISSDLYLTSEETKAIAVPSGMTVKLYARDSENKIAYAPVLKAIPTLSNLKGTDIEVGQLLSASKISGTAKDGDKNVEGVFAWKQSDLKPGAGANQKFNLIFTPNDKVNYKTAEGEATVNKITQYYTITPSVCTNGSMKLSPEKPGNRYEAGTTVSVIYTPASGDYNSIQTQTLVADQDKAVEAVVFAKKKQSVTVSAPTNGSIFVNGTEYKAATTLTVDINSQLSVSANPNEGYLKGSLKMGTTEITNGYIVVRENVTISATFVEKPEDQFTVSVGDIANGRIIMTSGDSILSPGKAVLNNTEVTLKAVPNPGYEFKEFTGVTVSGGKITVAKNTVIGATFAKKTFAVSTEIVGEASSVDFLLDKQSVTSKNVEYGDSIAISATLKDAKTGTHKLVSLFVNGKAIPATGAKVKVEGATKVQAIVEKLASITVDKTTQSFTYIPDVTRGFLVNSMPSGLTGFDVSYTKESIAATPAAAGTYAVQVERPFDAIYAKFSETSKLEIKKAVLGVSAPVLDEKGEISTTSTFGKYAITTTVAEDTGIGVATFTPTDNANYEAETFSVVNTTKAKPVALNPTKSSVLRAAGNDLTLTFTIEGEGGTVVTSSNPALGRLVILNGTEQVTSIYKGQELTVQAIPADGMKATVKWTKDNQETTGTTTTITLSDAFTLSATFEAKEALTPTIENIEEVNYTGTAFGSATKSLAISAKNAAGENVADNWSISFEKDGVTYAAPVEAGEYTIRVSRPADENYTEVSTTYADKFIIKKKEVTVSGITATPLMEGDVISMSLLSGTAAADGIFAWKDTVVVKKLLSDTESNGICTRKDIPVTFTLADDKNYVLAANAELKADLTYTRAAIIINTVNCLVNDATMGTATIFINGDAVQNLSTIKKDDVLSVIPSANSGYEFVSATATVSTGGVLTPVSDKDNTWTLTTVGDVTIIVTFKKTSTPPTPGGDVDVTGVALNATTKTLSVGDSFTLIPVVTPNDAADKSVSWSSSDPTVATVVDGIVTAVKNGTTTITVTTTDGGYQATCVVTVTGGATDIEDILADTQIYTKNGDIYIEPTSPMTVEVVNAAGYRFYAAEIADFTQVKVFAGIYFVKLTTAEGSVVRKVIVR